MAALTSILAWEVPWAERSLVGYCPLGHKESDKTKGLSTHTHIMLHQFLQPGTVLSPAVVVLDGIKKCRLFLL